MTGTSRYNDQNPTDPTTVIGLLLASTLLAKSLTTEEVQNLSTLLPILFTALPLVRR